METGRVYIIDPTRATCETTMALFEVGLFPTRLMEKRGKQILKLVRQKKRFGIIAGTGSGKTASLRNIIREEFGDGRELVVSMVNREYEATEKTWQSNVIVITPGIAMIWAKNGIIARNDLVIFDEIHQTSDHLELSEALSLYVKCRILWLSATVDPKIFSSYLESDKVVIFDEIDESKKAKVKIVSPEKEEGFLYELIRKVILKKRGMVMFLPTRREVEEYAKATERLFPGEIKVEFYHGGEPSFKLRPFLNKGVANNNRPFVIFMTNAGQSGLNIEGLNTVVVRDECITEELHNGVLVRTKAFLSTNDILQMVGRINGRVTDGEAFIISRRSINFHQLRPEKVKFVLGHNLERLALICGKLGINLSQLKLPEPVDKIKYAMIIKRLIHRGIFEADGINLTSYGRRVERIPSSAAAAEMIVNSTPETLNAVIISSSSSGLYRLLKPENDISEFVVSGSDHLTTYNIVAHAITNFADIADQKGYTEYRFREKEFYVWAEDKGINAKEIEEIVLAFKSILHNMNLPLPMELPQADRSMKNSFIKLLSEIRSLDVVRRQRDIHGNEIWIERYSFCEIEETIIGTISAWKDGDEIRRAVEGTEIPRGALRSLAAIR